MWRHRFSIIRQEVDAMSAEELRKLGAGDGEEGLEGGRNVLWGTRGEEEICRYEIADRRGIDRKSEQAKEAGSIAFHTWFTDLFYRSSGENIFEIRPVVLDLLRHSSIEEALVEKARLPFPFFYLHLGESSQITFGGGTHLLDGMYVENSVYRGGNRQFDSTRIEETLQFILTTRKVGGQYTQRTSAPEFLEDEPTLQVYASFEKDARFTAGIADALGHFQKETLLHDPKGRAFWDQASLRQALELMTNVLLFLSREEHDVTLRYPSDAPANLVKNANDPDSPRMRARSESKLQSLGFRRVHFIGDRLSDELAGRYSAGELTSAHWRRGHWRAQPHGQAFSLRKNVWIMPTIVRSDLGEPTPRRIYGVPR
jgi:hypothetical protein